MPANNIVARRSRMEPDRWIAATTKSLLDVGCNVGELLQHLTALLPDLESAGTDVNEGALDIARKSLGKTQFLASDGPHLPFEDERFDCVTCIEVIEHVPENERRTFGRELRRVLKPGGRLIIRCPHAGTFDWLDPQNFRFRFPRLYRFVAQHGRRDKGYSSHDAIVWHHHFAERELREVLGSGWRVKAVEFGGLALLPLSDVLRWPFYRLGNPDHWLARRLNAMASAEYAINFGRHSFGILMVMDKVAE